MSPSFKGCQSLFDWHVFIVYLEMYWRSNGLFWIEIELNWIELKSSLELYDSVSCVISSQRCVTIFTRVMYICFLCLAEWLQDFLHRWHENIFYLYALAGVVSVTISIWMTFDTLYIGMICQMIFGTTSGVDERLWPVLPFTAGSTLNNSKMDGWNRFLKRCPLILRDLCTRQTFKQT